MPVRPLRREQVFLLPPRLDELISADHPVRFLDAFVDQLDARLWAELGVSLQGEALGAPAYHPRLLLSVWLYGFMAGVRSSRKLETACREQLPYLWLTGLQTPDHNTLWRFYVEHRQAMRGLLKRTVRTAVASGLVDLALQAVDGSKLAGNAAKDRTYDREGLKKLLSRTEDAIGDLEAQNRSDNEPVPPRLPEKLRQKQALAETVKAALERIEAEERSNLTDADAVLLKGRDGFLVGYNGQAMVSPLNQEVAGRGGQLITAALITQDPADQDQLIAMLEEAAAVTGQQAEVTLADAGYHSGENLTALEERGQKVLMPEAQARALANPYHKDAFIYDSGDDSYTCPMGQILRHSKDSTDRKGRTVRVYRAGTAICRACPAFGQCTKDKQGRTLEIGPYDPALRKQRALMASAESKAVYSRRKELIEPTFGIIKEQQAGRRLLLRGLGNVEAEWLLLAVAFNLRTLARIWQGKLIVLQGAILGQYCLLAILTGRLHAANYPLIAVARLSASRKSLATRITRQAVWGVPTYSYQFNATKRSSPRGCEAATELQQDGSGSLVEAV
jgi:transposase